MRRGADTGGVPAAAAAPMRMSQSNVPRLRDQNPEGARLRRGARDAPGARPEALLPARLRGFGSSARTCSRSSRSSCGAPTTSSPRSTPEERARGVICVVRRQSRPGRRAGRAQAESPSAHRDARDRTPHQGRRGRAARRRGRCSHGSSYDEAKERADALAAERDMVVFIPPFDDPSMSLPARARWGWRSCASRASPSMPSSCSVGGGGLIAGIAAYIKALWPETRVIGVEPQETPTLHAALAAGERVVLGECWNFRRRRRGEAESAPSRFASRARAWTRSMLVDHRRNLRRDQGHLRRHALDRGAGGRACGCGAQALRRAGGRNGRAALRGGSELRRQRQLRPPAAHRPAGAARRAAGEPAGGDHSRAARKPDAASAS